MKSEVRHLSKNWFLVMDNLSIISGTAAGMVMFFVALITTYEVILRRIFQSPTTWVFSVSLLAMVWFALLPATLGMKEGRQITVDFFVSRLSDRTRMMLGIITYIISLIFITIFGYYGFQMCIEAYMMGIVNIGFFTYPKWLLYLAFPVTMLMCCLQTIQLIIIDIIKLKNSHLTRNGGWQDDPRIILPLFIVFTAFGFYLVQVNQVVGIIFLALCLMFGGLPVSFSLGCSGIAGLFLIGQGFASLNIVPVIVESTLHNFVLLAIPMFIMGGVILNQCEVGALTFDLASKWMSGLPGGLAIGTVIACAIFSAMVGVSAAVAAAIGLTAIPVLLSRGYSKELTYGSVAGGALGGLIPPSAGLIVYGFLTNSSVGKLFTAAFIPAFIVISMFCVYVVLSCVISGKYEKTRSTWKEKILSLKRAILGLSAPVIVLGGIYIGVFTPTEAAGVLVVYSIVVALIYKKLNWVNFIAIMRESAILGSMIMMVMMGAMILAHVISHLRVARILAETIATAGIPHWLIIIGIALMYTIMGMFLEGLSMTVLTIPVLYPLMPSLGLDVIVFGVILMIFVEMALITPPVGLNLFMIKAITDDKLWPIAKGNIPFAALLLVGAIILFLFPEVALWLPNLFSM